MNTQTKNKVNISAPLTMSDWLWHSKVDVRGCNDDFVRYVLTRCREFGLTRVYWRVFDGGWATYNSQLADIFYMNKPKFYAYDKPMMPESSNDILDYRNFDSLESAVRIGHELGLEIYAWMSINEEDHGHGFVSRFSRENPQCRWVRRNGYRYNSQISFAFPEVREYKLGLVKEVLAYNIDGLFIDWIRTGDNLDNPQTDAEGYADYGYETPNLERFYKTYGIDAMHVQNCDSRWVDVRCRPQTEFMREVRKLAENKKIIAMVQHPYSYRGAFPEDCNNPDTVAWIRQMKGCIHAGAKEGLLCDISTWASEGLVDGIAVSNYCRPGCTYDEALDYLDDMVGDRVERHIYEWLPGGLRKAADNEEWLKIIEERAISRGVSEVFLWEADYMDR